MGLQPRLIMAAAAILLLGGCGGTNLDDLRQFTANAYRDRKPQVEPLPQIRPHEGFAYTASALLDPFAATNLRPATANLGAAAGGRAPDPQRRREALEGFPLDSLKMVGTLLRDDTEWVILRAPDGTVHHAQNGNHVGQNYGVITAISEERLQITELIQDPNGKWIEREASLALAQE